CCCKMGSTKWLPIAQGRFAPKMGKWDPPLDRMSHWGHLEAGTLAPPAAGPQPPEPFLSRSLPCHLSCKGPAQGIQRPVAVRSGVNLRRTHEKTSCLSRYRGPEFSPVRPGCPQNHFAGGGVL